MKGMASTSIAVATWETATKSISRCRCTSMTARAEQPQKARLPMEVRLAERSMEMSEEQQTKALLPMETRLSERQRREWRGR